MKDPALLADAEKVNVGIEPMTGSAIANFVDDAYRDAAGGRRQGDARCSGANAHSEEPMRNHAHRSPRIAGC